MWPDNETDIDLLGFDFLVDGLVIALSEPRLLPLTVGVLGDWGSGKSSLMGLAQAQLTAADGSEADGHYVCVRFSPWQYEDYDDVKASLMSAVLTALADEAGSDSPRQVEVGRLKAFAQGFGRRSRRAVRGGLAIAPGTSAAIAGAVDPGLGIAAAMAQPGLEMVTTRLAERLDEPTQAPATGPAQGEPEVGVSSVDEFRSRFADLVACLDQVSAVVVFIDDLDRCLPETVVDTFEAIRLLLGVPRTAFVVAAHQKIVESAVDARYPELRGNGQTKGIGAQYLEKMLQLKITVPALSVPEAVTYVNLLLAELHLGAEDFTKVRDHVADQRASNTLDVAFNLGTLGELRIAASEALVADLQWAAAIAPVLATGSRGNPRQIKQFLNTLQLRCRSALRRGVTLDPAVLAKLMLLESQHFEDFQQLFNWQVASGGPACPQLATAERLTLDSESEQSPATEASAEVTTETGESRRPARARAAAPPPVDEAVQAWASKDPVRAWLQLPPRLSAVDLRPYFTYSRDRLSLAAVSAARLSGRQQQLLSWLLHSTDTVQRKGLDELSAGGSPDQESVVQALAQALLTAPEDAFVAVCSAIERISSSRDALFHALDLLPTSAVPAKHVPVAAARLPADDPRRGTLLDKWATAGRDDLAKMVAIVRRTANRTGH